MKKILLLSLFFFSLSITAQNNWPEAFTVSPDSAHYARMSQKYWQYYDMGTDSVPFSKVSSAGFDEKFTTYKQVDTDFKVTVGTSKQNVWVRYRLHNPNPFVVHLTLQAESKSTTFYITHNGTTQTLVSGYRVPWAKRDGLKASYQVVYDVPADTDVTVYAYSKGIEYSEAMVPQVANYFSEVKQQFHNAQLYTIDDIVSGGFFGFIIFAVIFNLLFYYVNRERVYLVYSITLLFSALYALSDVVEKSVFRDNYTAASIFEATSVISLMFMVTYTFRLFFRIKLHYPLWNKFLVYGPAILIVIGGISLIFSDNIQKTILVVVGVLSVIFIVVFIVGSLVMIFSFLRKKNSEARMFVLAALPFFISLPISMFTDFEWIVYGAGTWTILVLSWGMFARFKGLQLENARVALEKEEERSRLIARQNEMLEEQVAERTSELQSSIAELKQTQNQLIQSEKMASLGELTAGIAHEIQNPLNFVNNFSDVSIELLDEMTEELDKGDTEEVKAIASDIKQNLEKIAHHGRRADGIVKGMLQHSRASGGQKELTDINILADEYLRLAYHGLRAKDKSFNADLGTHFSEGLPKISVIPQDVGRVLLNLFTNAFYATQEKAKQLPVNNNQSQATGSYKPVVEISTRQIGATVEIIVKDNGTGIPDAIKDKILQPFFTTKPTGEGTGLGLSLSYDIIVKGHGGTIAIESVEGEGSAFKITLPIQ
jgi:two-component system NtrC family sensor kinase